MWPCPLQGGNPHDLKSPNNTEDDVPCQKDGGNLIMTLQHLILGDVA